MEKELTQLIEIQTDYFTEKKKEWKEQDHEKINTMNVMLKIQENNIIKKFIDEGFDNTISILKKYQNKRIGEKTREKIKEEIKSLNDSFEYVYFSHGYYDWDSMDWTLTIELKNKKYEHSRVKIEIYFRYWKETCYNTEHEGEYTIDINGYNKEKYLFIENVKEKATEIIKEYELLKNNIEERIKEINKDIDSYCEKYPVMLRTESQNINHIQY